MEFFLVVALIATAAFVAVTEIKYRKLSKQVERAEEMLRDARDLRRRLKDFGREIEAERERGN